MICIRSFVSVGLLLILLQNGCCIGCKPQHVELLKDQGVKRSFDASYDRVWTATIGALQFLEITIDDANKQTGYIAAHTEKRAESWGEEVGVWLARDGAEKTSVEVVSRRVGPHLLFKYDWEEPILYQIKVNLLK